MRKMNLLAALAATLLVGGTAVAKDAKPEGASKVKKICKVDSDSTSRISKNRVCRTKAEWREMTGRESSASTLNTLQVLHRGN